MKPAGHATPAAAGEEPGDQEEHRHPEHVPDEVRRVHHRNGRDVLDDPQVRACGKENVVWKKTPSRSAAPPDGVERMQSPGITALAWTRVRQLMTMS